MNSQSVSMRLPATSANLGPGFDAAGLALDFHLYVEAERAAETRLQAIGRNSDEIASAADNLILRTYHEVTEANGRPSVPLFLQLRNEIPMGMGCGSSAAALVAGVALASHFGELGWGARQILHEAARREGHPDNVAACVLGGFTVSAMRKGIVDAASIPGRREWQLLLVLPAVSLSTQVARGLLPERYARADAVCNVQNVALLTAIFAGGDEALLASAMDDRLHQPYRELACPLLPQLRQMAGRAGVLGVALSGAGPSVLLIASALADRVRIEREIELLLDVDIRSVELLWTNIAGPATLQMTGNLPKS